jgi:hypothetical protein
MSFLILQGGVNRCCPCKPSSMACSELLVNIATFALAAPFVAAAAPACASTNMIQAALRRLVLGDSAPEIGALAAQPILLVKSTLVEGCPR